MALVFAPLLPKLTVRRCCCCQRAQIDNSTPEQVPVTGKSGEQDMPGDLTSAVNR